MIKEAKSEGTVDCLDDPYLSLPKLLTTFTGRCTNSTVKAKTYEPSYNTALKCITYLSEDRRVAECRAFVVLPRNTDKIKTWLECIDRGEVSHYLFRVMYICWWPHQLMINRLFYM